MSEPSDLLDAEEFTTDVDTAVVSDVEGDVDELARGRRTQRIIIQFQRSGEGTLQCSGLGVFQCLGAPGLRYPKDLMVTEHDKYDTWHSQEFNVDMHYAIKIWGQRGIFIHLGPPTIKENEGPSAGCIHLGSEDAPRVYDWVRGRTRITISYPW